MPITEVHRDLVVVDRGVILTVQRQHDYDSNIWYALDQNGRTNVFTREYILALANSEASQLSGDINQVEPIVVPIAVPIAVPIQPESREDRINRSRNEITTEQAYEQALTLEILYMALPAAIREDVWRTQQRGWVQDIDEAHANANRDFMWYWQGQAMQEDHRRNLPRCPACHAQYEGRLGREHACTAIAAVCCSACRNAQVNLLGQSLMSNILCEACQDGGYFHCRKCARVSAPRGGHTSKLLCQNCIPRRQINIWDMVGRAQGNNVTDVIGSHRPFAVEIESFLDPERVEIRRVRMSDHGWEEGGDSSIHPDQSVVDRAQQASNARAIERIEFKSPPLMGDGGLSKLLTDVRMIRKMGFRANTSCGLHVHVDAAGFNETDQQALWKFSKWYEDDIHTYVADSRNNNRYCCRLHQRFDNRDRYQWLNLSSIGKHGTVEIRLHHGCVLPRRVEAWATLCVKFVEAGVKLGRARTKGSATMAEAIGLTPADNAYWEEVKRKLHPSAQPAVRDTTEGSGPRPGGEA